MHKSLSLIPCGIWVPIVVWQPCELLYTCYLFTYNISHRWNQSQSTDRSVFFVFCSNALSIYYATWGRRYRWMKKGSVMTLIIIWHRHSKFHVHLWEKPKGTGNCSEGNLASKTPRWKYTLAISEQIPKSPVTLLRRDQSCLIERRAKPS